MHVCVNNFPKLVTRTWNAPETYESLVMHLNHYIPSHAALYSIARITRRSADAEGPLDLTFTHYEDAKAAPSTMGRLRGAKPRQYVL